jgi:DNA-binding response OmpR family regulator
MRRHRFTPKIITSHRINLLLDLLLPEMNDLEICRRLRKEPSTAGIPIIMVTAKASEADFVNAREAGADDYITKPFSVRNVLERISLLLAAAENATAKN